MYRPLSTTTTASRWGLRQAPTYHSAIWRGCPGGVCLCMCRFTPHIATPPPVRFAPLCVSRTVIYQAHTHIRVLHLAYSHHQLHTHSDAWKSCLARHAQSLRTTRLARSSSVNLGGARPQCGALTDSSVTRRMRPAMHVCAIIRSPHSHRPYTPHTPHIAYVHL